MTWAISSLWFVLLVMMFEKGYQQRVCYRKIVTYVQRSRYHTGATAVVSHYYDCNWSCWGRWRLRCGHSRCTAYKTQYHQEYSGSVSEPQYHRRAVCCSGYTGSAPNCRATCSQGCFNNGVCSSPGICTCATGWTGRDCKTDIDECGVGTDTCSQVCANELGSYRCDCYSGYDRIARSDTDVDCNDINECQGNHGCDQNCSNLEGSYACNCNEGYFLQSDGRSCEDTNECIDDNGGCGHICDNTLGSYTCSCNDGFQLDEDGHNCSDIMECSDDRLHNCDQVCIELEGRFQCACNDGYELGEDNATCSDINECEAGLSGCAHNCINTDGSFTCSCLSGYSLDDDQKTCLDINECETNNDGCDHVCINTEGSYSCRCLEGYSLKEGSGECIAQPCSTLMMPSNGNISCNGTQTTGNVCTFTCNDGYEITGSYERTCLPTNEWSGNTTGCKLLQCNSLENPENGGILLPCGKSYGTVCTIQCYDGFYSESPNPVQVCQLVSSNNTVQWSEPPKCEEIQACTPNPCQHGGMCTVNMDRSFTCNCTGTMYTGINCENGIIRIPEYPSLIANIQYSFVVTAKPDENLILTILPDDRSAVIVNPQSVEFAQNINSHNFTIESKRSGLFKLNYRISGTSASEFKLPQPSSVIAIENNTNESSTMEYFESRGLPNGLLQAGCCPPPAFFLEYGCPSASGIVKFNATCAWNQKGLYSIGIVFSNYHGFGLPVAIAGIRLDFNFGLTSLSTFELRDPCNKCTQSLDGDDVVGLSTEECEQYKPSTEDVLQFLDSEALAFTYLYYSNQLLPQWLKFNVTQSMRFHDSKSYRVTLAKSSEIEKVEGCNITEVFSEGLYSVLMYSGILNVSVNFEEFSYKPQIHPVCFAVNLCEGKSSPMYISIPPGASDIVSNHDFMENFKLWNIMLHSVSITFNTITAGMYESTYWNGIEDISLNLKNYNLVLSNGLFYSHPIKDFHLDFSFTGATYLSNTDIQIIFSREIESSNWIGYMVGNVEFSTKLLINGTRMSLILSDNENQHILLSGDDYSSRACEGCNNSAGIAFKLNFHSNQNTNGLFAQLLKVPPKEEFGLPTQFSCPVDVFAFLNKSLVVEASIYRSTCLSLHLGLLPFENLENVVYIFDECVIKSYCNHFNFANKTNLIIWSYLKEPVQEIDMGYFIKLLPVTHINKSAIVTTFSGETYDLKAQLFNVQFSMFDTVVNTTAFIDKHKLTSEAMIDLYAIYPTQVKIAVSQVSSWDKSSISVHGTLMHTPHNIPLKLASYINDYLSTLHTRALMKIKNAENVYNNAISQQESAIETVNQQNNSKFLNDIMYQAASDDLNNQIILVRNISDELQEANEEIKELQDRIDNICMIQSCEEICVPSEVCGPCERQVSTLIQGDCTVDCEETVTVTELVRYEQRYRWQYVPRRYCRFGVRCSFGFISCFTSFGCRTRGVCVRLPYFEPIFQRRAFTVRSVCTRPCPADLIMAPIMDRCCTNGGCEQRRQNQACASENEQCSATRNRIYEELAREQVAAAVLLQRYDEANAHETTLKLQLAQLTIRKTNLDERFNESKESLADAMAAVDLASSTYTKIRDVNKLDQLERLKKTVDNISNFDIVNITNATFNTVVISQSPTVLQLHFDGDIAHIRYRFSEKVTVDFDRLEMSLREAAILIAENSVLNATTYSKRALKYRRQDDKLSDDNDNYLHFQAKCTDIQNIIEYVKELNKSLALLENVTSESVSNAINNKKEIIKLIDEYTTIYNQPMSINIEKINKQFNISINATEQAQVGANLSTEEELNLNILKEHLNSSQDIGGSKGKRLLTIWRNKMDRLHNMTSSAAGHDCIGFSDCLQEVAQVLEDLLSDSPFTVSSELLQQFPTISHNFLSLSLLNNGTFASAIKSLTNFYVIAGDSSLMAYWCATPPLITEHPVARVNPHENMTIELFCKTISNQFTTYRWKKDGIELPNHKHSTLVLHNAKRHDSGNYTCEVTNHVGSTKSTGAIVDVQQLPWFFLQPDNIEVHTGDPNGAIFTSNATGWPYPGFRWYFKPKNSSSFTQIPNENENELVISNPRPENEGSYYCEAFNEQGFTKSAVINLTVLDVAVVQLSQLFSMNFTSIELFSGSGSINESDNAFSGSGTNDISGSGSGVEQTALDSNSSSAFQSKTELEYIQDQVKDTLSTMINLNDNTVENISVHSSVNNTMLLTFTVYSKNFSYSEMSLENLNQFVVLAQADWFEITKRVKELLTSTSIVITSGDVIYSSEPNSTIIGFTQTSCPPGKGISSSNVFLCVNCAPGKHQAIKTVSIDSQNNEKILNSVCVPCQMGHFQDTQGQVACKACPDGYTTRNTSSQLPEDCYKECDKGYYSTNGLEPCSRCPNGTYSPDNGLTMCVNCTQFNYSIPGYCELPQSQLDPCNSRCDHRCSTRTKKCSCNSGYVLASDGFSCLQCASVEHDIISPLWHVALCNNSNTSLPLVCSGSLLSDQWVLTSANCVCNVKNKNDIVVRNGKVHTCNIFESGETEHTIEAVFCYSDFNSTIVTTDLALIKINSSEKMQNIRPVCLKHGRRSRPVGQNDQVVFFGWDSIASTVTSSHAILNKSITTIVPKKQCKSSFFKEDVFKVDNSVFCTIGNVSDACTGNPGSGVVVVNRNDRILLQGVISRSTKSCGISESVIAHSKVQSKAVQKWIKKTLKK